MKKNGIMWKASFFSILYVFLFSPVSFSAVYKISDSFMYDRAPSLYNGTIAWSAPVSPNDSDNEIYYWDGNLIHQITDNSTNDSSPSLYNGTIAWSDGSTIYYWDGSTVHQITDGTVSDKDPSLYNGAIAWRRWFSSGVSEIFYWNGSHGSDGSPNIVQITNNASWNMSPSLYNGTIAWDSNVDGNEEIYFWDGSITHKITDNNGSHLHPSLYNGTIAWKGYVDGTSEIYYWNGTRDPQDNPIIEKITNYKDDVFFPSLYDGAIVWYSGVDGDYEIYYWDGTRDLSNAPNIEQITNNTGHDSAPSLYNGTIAWESDSYSVNADYDIYFKDTNSPPVANAGDGQTITFGETLSLDGTGSSDTDGTIVSWDWLLEHQGDSSNDKTATGETATVSNLVVGSYTVTLTVTDDDGVRDSDTMLLGVLEVPHSVIPSAGANGDISPSITQTVNHGAIASFVITPDANYHINWVTGCFGTLEGNTYTTGAVTTDCTVTASFAIDTHSVIPSAGANGSISPPTAQTVNHDATTSFLINPDTNYHINTVTGCGGTLSGNTYTTAPVIADCAVTTSFAINTHTVTPSAGTNGSIAPSTPQTVDHGSTTSFSINPNIGYHIGSVTGTCGGILAGNTFTTDPVTSNCTVNAVFALNAYTVTPFAEGDGSIAPPAPQTINHGSTTTFTVTPDEGYTSFVGGTCGGILDVTTYTTNTIISDCTVVANFGINMYLVNVPEGQHGAISPYGEIFVNHDEILTFTLTPDDEYKISEVTGCDGSLTDNIYTTGDINGSCEVIITFAKDSFPWTMFLPAILSAQQHH